MDWWSERPHTLLVRNAGSCRKGDIGRTDIVQHQIHTGDKPESECLVYLDDILFFGPDFGTMLARLESVLDRLGEAGLKLKAKKCQLFQEEIPFLGHLVSAAGIGTDPAKCQQVRDWPVPQDLHEVRSFVGLCLYYRRHIQGFTELAAPLYELATKGTDFKWTNRGTRPSAS